MRNENNDKEVIDSGWFGVEHISENHHVDWFRFVNMETLCKMYPQLFRPEIWLSENPPKIGLPKKKLVKRSK